MGVLAKINDYLEQMAQVIFDSWFANFDTQRKFTDVVRVLGGGTPKTTISEYWGGDIPFFTPKDASKLYTFVTEKNLTSLGLSKCNSSLYPKNTVFLTARGTVGKLTLAGRPMAMNQSCYALLGNKGYGQFFTYHLVSKIIPNLKNGANGTVFETIISSDFDNVTMVSPSAEASIQFDKMVAPIYASIFVNSEESMHLASLRDILLHHLISRSDTNNHLSNC
jgi:type I restriction enzyme S subunit